MEGGVRRTVEIIPGGYFLKLDVRVVAWRKAMVGVVPIRLFDFIVNSQMNG